MGGAAIVVDAGATRGVGGVEGAAWDAGEVMGAARGITDGGGLTTASLCTGGG
jgi:hypothetical protein